MLNTAKCNILKAIGLCTAVLGLPAAGKTAEQPNIVFILSDDHAPEAIGAYDLRLSAFCRDKKINCRTSFGAAAFN